MKFKIYFSSVILLSFLIIYTIYHFKLPVTDFKTSYVSNEVNISVDEFGTPYIKASNWKDAQFALGLSMARDRLWQMEILRRVSAGRVSEIVGKKALEVDKLREFSSLERPPKSTFKIIKLNLKFKSSVIHS